MSKIKIGWASRDVSTDKPLPVPGQAHMRINRGVLDPVTVTTLVLDDGNDSALFITMDVVHIYACLMNELTAHLKEVRPDIPAEKIVFTATHTHAGPAHCDSEGYFAASDDPDDIMPVKIEVASGREYRAYLVATMTEMVAEAWDNRKEGGVAYGYGYAVVAHSRRVCYFDDISKRSPKKSKTDTFSVNGTAAMYGNTNDDNFSHYEAGADHYINLLYTFDENGKLTGAIVNAPCPSQNSEGMWNLSASFWNEVRVNLRKQYGEDLFILPQCAAGGDLAPRTLHYKKAQARRYRLKFGTEPGPQDEWYDRMDIAERIAEAFGEVLTWAQKDIRTEMPISHTISTIDLPRLRISEEEYEFCKEGLAESKADPFVETDDPVDDFVHNSTIISNRKRFLNIIKRYEKQDSEPTMPMETHIIRVGDIAFASNPFELYMDFQHRIQARSPFEQTFLVQLCAQSYDEIISYLCTERALAGKGYSAIPFSCQISPEGGQKLVDETVKVLKQLR